MPLMTLSQGTEILTSEYKLSYELVSAHCVKVHDCDIQSTVPYLLPRDVEFKGSVEDRVQVALINLS